MELKMKSLEDFFDPEVIDPLVWLKQSFSKLRSAYKVSSNIKDNELLSVISAEALKDNTAPDFKRRIQYLLVKYKDTLCRLNGDLKLDAISVTAQFLPAKNFSVNNSRWNYSR